MLHSVFIVVAVFVAIGILSALLLGWVERRVPWMYECEPTEERAGQMRMED